MKKSNKLLLGGFLTVVLLITGIHIALYAKYKNGHYTTYRAGDNKPDAMKTFPGVTKVAIKNCLVHVQFGDVLSIEKGKEKFIEYRQQGDSLVITGLNTVYAEQRKVKLVIPADITLAALQSTLDFENGHSNREPRPIVFLDNSAAVFSFYSAPTRLAAVKVHAVNRSDIELYNNAAVDNLEVTLNNSSLDCFRSNIGQLSISTDSASVLKLDSKHLLKATIKSASNNP